MIPPNRQWAHQIAITSACRRRCSNCTRLLAHETKNYFMSLEDFEQCVRVAADFPTNSNPDVHNRRKVVGIFGGEPLLHPQFPAIVELACQYIPDIRHRGLWTGEDWPHYEHQVYGPAEPHVLKLLGEGMSGATHYGPHTGGYLNWNRHGDKPTPNDLNILPADNGCHSRHQPMLVAIDEVIENQALMWRLIEDCWVQRDWSAAYAYDAHNRPRFYFCEVASALDRVLNLGVGLPVQPYCWDHELWFAREGENSCAIPQGLYAAQINQACRRCGACLPLDARLDSEDLDDISPVNVKELRSCGSQRVKNGQFVEFDTAFYDLSRVNWWRPQCYIEKKQ